MWQLSRPHWHETHTEQNYATAPRGHNGINKYFNYRTKPRLPPGHKTFCMLAAVGLSPQRVRQRGRCINETKQTKNTEKQKHLTEKEAINYANERLYKRGAKTTQKRKEVIAVNSHRCTISKLMKQINRKRAKKPLPKKLCMHNN